MYVEGPGILNDIAAVIEKGQASKSVLDSTFAKLQASIEREFCSERWMRPIFEQVREILDKGSPNFQRAISILDDAKIPQETCTRIIQLAAAQTTDKLVRMQLRCFAYLILIEGVYDNVLRFLYAVHKKKPFSKSNIKSIFDNFAKARIGSALVDGWNPIARNAIAHATFSLDPISEKATFEDRLNHTSVTMSFDEFALLVDKVLHVGIAVSTLLMGRIMVIVAFNEALTVAKSKH